MTPTAITLSGLTGALAGLSYGNPANPPVIALHGWLDNAASFTPMAELLDKFHVVALDFPGHGQSAKRPRGTKYHLTDYVADVAHGVEDLGFSRFHLMGHSLGAGVAIVYAALYPEKVQKLVLIDGIGPISAPPEAAAGRLRKAVDAGLEAARADGRAPAKPRQWPSLVAARRKASPLSEAAAELLLKRGTTQFDKGVTVNADPRIKHPSPLYLTEDVVLHFIRQVKAATLLLLAKDGMVIHRANTAERINAFSNLKVVECPGQHHLHMDDAAAITREIEVFLQE